MKTAPPDKRHHNAEIQRASLDNPLYYLANLETVIHWVRSHHSDLLEAAERSILDQFIVLPKHSRALLARLSMRSGTLFRDDALRYREIPSIDDALRPLVDAGWVALNPTLTANDVHKLCRRAELLQLLTSRGVDCPRTLRKSEMLAPLQTLVADHSVQTMQQWWPEGAINTISLLRDALLQRIRLMFFGNLYQDWSEFVLAELGYQRYEAVSFTPQSRAFSDRNDVDDYLDIYHCQTALAEGVPVNELQLPGPSTNSWLEHRRQKLLFQLAHHAERCGDIDTALQLYRDNPLEEALVRQFRVLEKSTPLPEQLLPRLDASLHNVQRPETLLHLQRIQHRLRRKAGQPSPIRRVRPIPSHTLLLRQSEHSVEIATLAALTENSSLTGFYSENTLFTGLFGLLFWPVLFEPLPGAFFHPFQAGPADLFRADFVTRRQTLIDQRLRLLETKAYQQEIWKIWQAKHGISCTLIHWPAMSEALVQAALRCIPAEHLRIVFRHLLSDLRHHRRGMPDLVLFDTAQCRYQLIEVKGPGDRLQDHQRLWIETMLQAGLPVSVAEVDWESKS